ncbi:MAG: hypothetical protein R3D52_03320 [Xanthobacteraceae bacterium]
MMEASFRVEHATRSSRIGLALFAVLVLALAAAPYWADRQQLRLLAEIFSYIVLASLWNLLAGYADLFPSVSRPMSGSAPMSCSR